MYMSIFSARVDVHNMHVCPLKSETASSPLELRLRMVANCLAGDEPEPGFPAGAAVPQRPRLLCCPDSCGLRVLELL